MNSRDVFVRRSEPGWMNAEPPPDRYGGDSPRTEIRCIMCCNKCEEKVLEEIGEIYGVQEVFTDPVRSEVVVCGYADTHELLKKARKVDKRADIMASDSFTLHRRKGLFGLLKHSRIHHKHDKHSYKYDKVHHSRSLGAHHHGHSLMSYNNNRSSSLAPIESVGSPRYNSSFNQFRRGGNYTSSYDAVPDFHRHSYNQYRPRDVDYRHVHDGYRSEPEFSRHHYNHGAYRPHSDYRTVHGDHRDDHGYRPSQSYLPRNDDYRDYRDSSPYPETINPNYMQPLEYYY